MSIADLPTSSFDVAVVGGGPIGCAAALAHARAGRSVLLVEAKPDACRRLAGEWIHPPGVRVLEELGVDLDGAHPGRGFVLFGDDGGPPVELPYPNGNALSLGHDVLVERLRSAAAANGAITTLLGRVTSCREGVLGVTPVGDTGTREFRARRIVGADGRASVVRRALGLATQGVALSYMAAVDLEGVDLPFEGMGHVLLGGPGPVLMYRVNGTVRACLDIPLSDYATRRKEALERFVAVFPRALREPLVVALNRGELRWAKNGFSARSHFGRGTTFLAGDALGFVHPATAGGLTNGLLDARALPECRTIQEYAVQRRNYTPELLANLLYEVFARSEPRPTRVRHSLLQHLRDDVLERERTMRLLSGEERSGGVFARAFVRTAARCGRDATSEVVHRERPKRDLIKLAGWMAWPAAAVLPAPVAQVFRRRSTSDQPLRLSRPSSRPPASTSSLPPPPAPARRETTARKHLQRSDVPFCDSMLKQVSRSFSKPIGVLPEDLRLALTVGYLLCRVADTVEDHAAVPLALRAPLFEAFLAVLNDQASPMDFVELFTRVIPPPGLPDDAELTLCRNLDVVFRTYQSQTSETRQATRRWVSEMCHGMRAYSQRVPGADGFVAMHSIADLERYCYYVAGTVGHLITDLFLEHMREDPNAPSDVVLRANAESFGIGLQLVNILKDVTDDRERGWSFVPRDVCANAGIEIAALVDPGRRERAHAAIAPLFSTARRHLGRALDYTLEIPSQYTRLRLFCLLPLWMAGSTLRLAQNNDAVFEPGRAVKISKAEVARIIAECTRYAVDDDALRQRFTLLDVDASVLA